MFKRLIALSLTFGMAATAPPAFAAACGARDAVVDKLESKFSEQLIAGGLQASSRATSVLEVWTSPETGTFTVLVTKPNGVTCVVAAGTNFFSQDPVVEPAGIPG